MTIRHLLVVLFLVSSAAVHAATVTVDPPDPTSTTPVILIVTEHDTCPPDPVVTRDGFTINVTLGAGICLTPPHDIVHRLDVGLLPAGTYQVNVTDESDEQGGAAASFVVLDGNSVTASPSMGKRGAKVRIFADLPCPGHAICPVPQVFFGGVEIFHVEREGDHWVVIAPNHAPGLVEVRVTNGQSTKSAFAFRYIDPDAPPSEVLFEKVLFPIVFNGPGAFGSQWVTEVSVRNDEPFDIFPWRPFFTSVNLPTGSALTGTGSRPQGMIVFMPRIPDENIHYNVLVRDTSRQADDWGTQIPVLREDELKPGPKELLNVPLDPRYRLTLRLYTLGSAPAFARVRMYTMTVSGGLLHERVVPLTSLEPCQSNAPCLSDHPAFAMIGDLPTNFEGLSRVGIQIEGLGVPVWGFLTVTNNETQHVTVISPE